MIPSGCAGAVGLATLLVTATGVAGGASAGAAPYSHAGAIASAAANVSGNWSGYAISLPGGNSKTKAFRSVTSSWVVQPVKCVEGSRSYASFWVGLGGYYRTSRALEQIGTEADCARNGRAIYNAWYELVPMVPVTVHVALHPGDSVTARVTVAAHRVALELHNLTTGASFARTVRFNTPDTSSAEWIAEAPSACDQTDNCVSLRLANFGTISFSGASAVAADGHQGAISDPGWRATKINLRQSAGGGRFGIASGAVLATPTAVSGDGSSFSVTWSGVSGTPEQPPPGLIAPDYPLPNYTPPS